MPTFPIKHYQIKLNSNYTINVPDRVWQDWNLKANSTLLVKINDQQLILTKIPDQSDWQGIIDAYAKNGKIEILGDQNDHDQDVHDWKLQSDPEAEHATDDRTYDEDGNLLVHCNQDHEFKLPAPVYQTLKLQPNDQLDLLTDQYHKVMIEKIK